MGELVITQAMLAQNSRSIAPALYQSLVSGLTALDRNTRDLQEAVMSIRMIPMQTVFSRFPRMLRDLANQRLAVGLGNPVARLDPILPADGGLELAGELGLGDGR